MLLAAYLRQQAPLTDLRQADTRPVPATALRRYVQEHSAAADYAIWVSL